MINLWTNIFCEYEPIMDNGMTLHLLPNNVKLIVMWLLENEKYCMKY